VRFRTTLDFDREDLRNGPPETALSSTIGPTFAYKIW